MSAKPRLIDGLSDENVRALFDRARDADYADVVKAARALSKSVRPNAKSAAIAELRAQVARLRKRLAEVVSIDFFGRETAEGLVKGLEGRLNKDEVVTDKATVDSGVSAFGTLRNRTWVTRQDVYVDRIASAWLIRRFIDFEAQFKFVSGKGYRPHEGELRFDMFEAEFTHEGDKCTFEVLLERCALNDPALRAIAEAAVAAQHPRAAKNLERRRRQPPIVPWPHAARFASQGFGGVNRGTSGKASA